MPIEFLTGKLVTLACGQCHVEFAIPDWLYHARKADHHTFWCPHGHGRCFPPGKTTEEILRERVKDLEASRDSINQQRQAALADAKRQAAQVRRLRSTRQREQKRALAGVCPCCQRTVSQMARHIKTKHPDYQPTI